MSDNIKEKIRNKYNDLKSDYQAYAEGIRDGIANNEILSKMERQGNPYYGSGTKYHDDYIGVQDDRQAAKKDAIKKTLIAGALGTLAGAGVGALAGNTGLGAGLGGAVGIGSGLSYNGSEYYSNLGTDQNVKRVVDPMIIAENAGYGPKQAQATNKKGNVFTRMWNKWSPGSKEFYADATDVGMSAMHGNRYYGNGVNFSDNSKEAEAKGYKSGVKSVLNSLSGRVVSDDDFRGARGAGIGLGRTILGGLGGTALGAGIGALAGNTGLGAGLGGAVGAGLGLGSYSGDYLSLENARKFANSADNVNYSRSVNDLLALKRLFRITGKQDFSSINDLSYRLYMFNV